MLVLFNRVEENVFFIWYCVEDQIMAEDEVMEDVEEQYIPEGGIRIGDIYIPPPPAPACTFDSTGPRLEFPSCLITIYWG